MNKIQNLEERLFYTKWLLFWVRQNGGTPETETRAKLIPNFFCVQNQDSAELTPENTSKVNIVDRKAALVFMWQLRCYIHVAWIACSTYANERPIRVGIHRTKLWSRLNVL